MINHPSRTLARTMSISLRRGLVIFLMIIIMFNAIWNVLVLLKIEDYSPNQLQNRGRTVTLDGRERSKRSKKPHFVLHVGPQKTATTTIQCGLQKYASFLAVKDSYYFIGQGCQRGAALENNETSVRGLALYYELGTNGTHERAFIEQTERHFERGSSLILSNEAFSNGVLLGHERNTQVMRNLLKDWSIRIVVSYRNFSEWISSAYYQDMIGRGFIGKWDKEVKSFQDFFQEYAKNHNNDYLLMHPTISTYNIYSKYFDHIHIFDIHSKPDVFKNFVCLMLPSAERTCNELKRQIANRKQTTEVQRVSTSLVPFRIADAAYRRGLVPEKMSKIDAGNKINKYLEELSKSNLSRFTSCLDEDTLVQIHNISLSSLQKVREISGLSFENAEHILDEKNLFCEIDPQKVLADSAWLTFFSGLN